MKRPVGHRYGGTEYRLENLVGDGGKLAFRATADDNAELIGRHPADHVGVAQAFVESQAHGDHGAVGDIAAIGVGDDRQVVDGDREVGAGRVVTGRVGKRMIEQFAQAHTIIMAGDLVEVGQPRQMGLVVLVLGDDPNGADRPHRPAFGVALNDATILDPAERAVVAAQAVFHLVGLAGFLAAVLDPGEHGQILAVDPADEFRARGDGGCRIEAEGVLDVG